MGGAAVVALPGLAGAAPVRAQRPACQPVTDQLLESPDPGDWLHWRRTLDGWGYSPLDQINRDTVHLPARI